MDNKVIEQIKQNLVEQKANLENELAKFAHPSKNDPTDYQADFPDYGNDETENTNEVATYDVNLSLEATLEKELRDVNKALDRIEKGTYGTCKYCKQEIDDKRLLARPTSSACISCKTKLKSL
ncbi:MAG TPA: TraR/DksA family transcriptional regulator [Candidatus Bipolaricaulota bacterium]|nr:TraR/DksA family transcriptional regulator [Candidatus Bipolaricaulota bacterium]